MNINEQTIHRFYTAFQERNYEVMQDCYADEAKFSDEAFQNLNASQVRAMWKMLCLRGKDLQLEFTDVKADDTRGSCQWTARYTFSKTGRRVENKIAASFVFKDGKIIDHVDSFDFYKWIKQAIGPVGMLLGWTGFFQNKVRATAMASLHDFIKSER